MRATFAAAAIVVACTSFANAQMAETLKMVPSGARTVTDWYKQSVYDPSDKKVGEIEDVLVGKDGKIDAVILSVGGFLGMGSKDVAAPFASLMGKEKDGKWYLTMNTTADALKSAQGYKYDKTKTTWMPETK